MRVAMPMQVIRVWGRILAAVPRSRLVLKNKPFACDAAKAHFMRMLEEVSGAVRACKHKHTVCIRACCMYGRMPCITLLGDL